MSKVRVANLGVSLDGYSARPGQTLKDPFGPGGIAVMNWYFPTQSFHAMQGKPGGETGIDNQWSLKSMENMGAWILGRNMFGPIRGPWPDDEWKGWWGKNPPYHVPTFVLTHHPRPSITMEGGTVFHFVTDGIHSALAQARKAAGNKDIRIGGGAATIRQYLQARAIDELHIAQADVLLGAGESIFTGTDLTALGYEVAERVVGERAVHWLLRKRV